jgi:hypothetical protein
MKCGEGNCFGVGLVPVNEVEILLSIRYIEVIITLLIIAAVAWQCAGILRLLNDEVCVTVLHGFIISVIEGHWILMVDVQVRRVLVQEESARAARWQGD